MGRFIKGDIVVLPFPFSDLSSSKRRPALVLVDLKGNDIILCQITSKNIYDDMSVTIDISDIENGSLNDTSNIRLNKLFTADENIILYKLGNLYKEKLDEITAKIINMFGKTDEFKVGVKSIILYNRKVLLVQRSDISGTGGTNEWEFPGGLMEFEENLHTALRREIKEETGLEDICIEKLVYAMTVKVSPERRVVGLTYLSRSKTDSVKISDEHIDFIWANKEQLIKLLNKTMLDQLIEINFLDSIELD